MGSDQYWGITTGEIVKIRNCPTALDTQLGWVLSGPVAIDKCSESQTTLVTHVLRVDSKSKTKALDRNLRAFWGIESLGILKREDVVQAHLNSMFHLRMGIIQCHCLGEVTAYHFLAITSFAYADSLGD